MNWQEIMEQVLAINELQQEVLIKSQNSIIKQIIKRNEKYLSKSGVLDIKSLNNAILEHQIVLTPYQIIILSKINELSLNVDPQSLYINMPESQEEAEKYVVNLRQKYELAINCFDLVMDIESLSQTEYTFDYPFEKSIYAQKCKMETDIFLEIVLNDKERNKEKIKKDIKDRYEKFIDSLTIEERKQLLLESLVLSYDRNIFNFFNQEKMLITTHFNQGIDMAKITEIYNIYQNHLMGLYELYLSKMSLQEIYDEFKMIYEIEFVKQKIKKK